MLRTYLRLALLLLGVSTLPGATYAQNDGDRIIELNLSGPTSLPRLVEAVSRQMNVRYLYSADLANRQVTVYTPARFPKRALPALLGSLLKGENLAIVDSEVEGWKRIVDIADIVPNATPGEATDILARDGPAGVVTQVVPVRYANITSLSGMLRPFLSKASNFIVLPENRLIIVTDYAGNVKTLVELLELIDQPSGQAVIEFYDTKNRTPASLVEQVEALLRGGGNGGGGSAKSSSGPDYKLFNDTSGRRVVVAGLVEQVQRILDLLKQLDTGMDFQTRVYRLQHVSVQRIDRLIRGLVSEEESESSIESTVDEDGNLLIVRASAEIHRQVEMLVKELDRPVDSAESPIRFYKLKNANAIEVLYSLLALQQAAGSGGIVGGRLGFGAFGTLGGVNVGGVNAGGINGVNPFGSVGGVPGGLGTEYRGDTGGQAVRMPFEDGSRDPALISQNQNTALSPLIGNQAGVTGLGGVGVGGIGGGVQVATLPGGARVSADVATNSLIVYAPASVQPLYEELIRSLDQRRPQVMIEAQIVAVDTSDNFSLGVEVSTGDRDGNSRLFKFTSFGLSQVDPTTGRLTPIPSLGFNGVLLDPEVADVIVQALSTHARSRLLASPKILVNDNQEGKLESVASVPFRSINTINTISSESLGGDQEAGTIITVTPHINEDDHLQLEFEVEFSTFTGQGDANLPPPRQIDRVRSVVTIPDGKTVVVGGLKRIGQTESFSGVPWIEKVPVLRELTSLTTEGESTISFFLFIRPKILRDSRFRDLRYLSEIDLNDARIPGDYPVSRPIAIPCLKPPKPAAMQMQPQLQMQEMMEPTAPMRSVLSPQ